MSSCISKVVVVRSSARRLLVRFVRSHVFRPSTSCILVKCPFLSKSFGKTKSNSCESEPIFVDNYCCCYFGGNYDHLLCRQALTDVWTLCWSMRKPSSSSPSLISSNQKNSETSWPVKRIWDKNTRRQKDVEFWASLDADKIMKGNNQITPLPPPERVKQGKKS